MELATRKVPPLSHDRLARAAKRALNYAAVLGVTSVQDMANPGRTSAPTSGSTANWSRRGN